MNGAREKTLASMIAQLVALALLGVVHTYKEFGLWTHQVIETVSELHQDAGNLQPVEAGKAREPLQQTAKRDALQDKAKGREHHLAVEMHEDVAALTQAVKVGHLTTKGLQQWDTCMRVKLKVLHEIDQKVWCGAWLVTYSLVQSPANIDDSMEQISDV